MSDAKKSPNKNLKDDIDASVKLFDVAQPGKTAAPTTSRPVIVGHKATTKRDPMVVDSEEEKPKEEPQMTRSKPLTIKPIESSEPQPQPQQDEEKTETPESPKEESAEPEEPAPKVEESPAGVEASPSATVEALAKDVTADQSDKKEKHDLAVINEEAEKLIASKQFFVPIGQDYKSSSRLGLTLIICLLLVVLVLAGVNLAIDAEMIDIGVNPLTDIL